MIIPRWSPEEEAAHQAFSRYFAEGQVVIARDRACMPGRTLWVREDQTAVDRTFEGAG